MKSKKSRMIKMKAKVKLVGQGRILTGTVFPANKPQADLLEKLGLAERYCEVQMEMPTETKEDPQPKRRGRPKKDDKTADDT